MWEYEFLIFSLGGHGGDQMDKAQAELNAAGAEGWEAVSLLPKMGKDESWCIALLKRPRK
jgi:hypothetical protein